MKKGFTLIELLVVIAIISILAAISFPVFARAKEQAYRSSDITNMNSIRTALQLYKADQGAYPPALLGYATNYAGNNIPLQNDVLPANLVVGALYPKRIDSLSTLQPSQVRPVTGNLNSEFTTAVWPNAVAPSGTENPGSFQRFGPEQVVTRCVDGQVIPNYYYRTSGYDASSVRVGTSTRTELRYTLFWSAFTVPADPCNPSALEMGSAADDPRQLGYDDPPESTIVTWNSYFRDYTPNGVPTRTKKDIVLFLGGGARTYDSVNIATQSYKALP